MQHHHLDTPVSPLRQRLIDDMNMRRFSRETQRNYLRDIGRLAAFLGRSPDTATANDLRRFQIEQQEDGVPVPTMNSAVSALRCLVIHTLDRPDLARRLVRLAHRRNLPVVLSRDEVARLLNATTSLKKAALSSPMVRACAAEVSMLKVADVDSERMLLRVERGKGGRYRNAMLSEDLLALLREWWKVGRQQGVMHRDGWLSRTPRDELDQHAATLSHRRRGGPGRRHCKTGRPAHAAPQLCDPPAGGRHRHPGHPGTARARQAEQHGPLRQGRDQDGSHGHEPARQAWAVQADRISPDG